MALWDSPDLLGRTKRLAKRPSADEDKGPTDATADDMWYALLTEAQVYWHAIFTTHFPWLLWTAPTKLATADNGLTYTFPNGVTPSKVELYDAPNGRLQRPGAYWDTSADYIWEGARVRFPRNAIKTFADGPYARYIVPPAALDAANAPVLQPDWARILLPPRACVIWADRGGLRDPSPYAALETELWYGDPARGRLGILAVLKTQNPFAGAAAFAGPMLDGFAYLNSVATGYR